MKHLTIILFLIMACSAFGQFNNAAGTFDIDSAATLSNYFDLGSNRLGAFIFDADTLINDTLYILTSATTDSADFKRVQYNNADVMIFPSVNQQEGLTPAEVKQLLRYIKVEGSTAEDTIKTITVVKTNF